MTTPRRPRPIAPRALALALTCMSALALLLPSSALGQGAPDPETEQRTEPKEEPARSLAEQETGVPGGVLLLIAYILLWVMLFVVLLLVMHKQRALAGEIATLEQRLEQAFAPHDDPDAQG